MNGEKQKFIGGINFEELRAQRVQVYNTVVIDLTDARSNQERVFTGTYVYALEGTDVDANLNIKFNELFRNDINLVKGRGVRCPFYRFYLSHEAQAGKSLTLVIGIESADFEIFDVGKALGITGTVNVAQTATVNVAQTATVQVAQTGTVQVAQTGTVDVAQTGIVQVSPKRPVGSSQVQKSEVTVATVVMHTVTAGKTLYITACNLSQYNASVSPDLVQMFITDAADAVKYRIFYWTGIVGEAAMMSHSFSMPLEVQEGYKVKISGTTDNYARGFFCGYEV